MNKYSLIIKYELPQYFSWFLGIQQNEIKAKTYSSKNKYNRCKCGKKTTDLDKNQEQPFYRQEAVRDELFKPCRLIFHYSKIWKQIIIKVDRRNHKLLQRLHNVLYMYVLHFANFCLFYPFSLYYVSQLFGQFSFCKWCFFWFTDTLIRRHSVFPVGFSKEDSSDGIH